MKKVLSLIIGILVTITLISCDTTKVIEENTKENNESSKYTITERNIENIPDNNFFTPLFYNNDKIYGKLLEKSGDEFNKSSIFSYSFKNGKFKDVEEEFTDEEINFINSFSGGTGEGICMIDSNKLSDRKFYFMDVKNKVKFELNEFEKTYSSMEFNLKNFINLGYKLDGNDNYFIYRYLSQENNEIGENQEIIIIDIQNKNYYRFNNKDKIFIYFYYDNSQESIMAIDEAGKISKVTLEENNVFFKEHSEIKLGDEKIYNKFGYYKPDFNNNSLILRVENKQSKQYMDYYNIIYNTISNETIFLDKEKIILESVNNSNFYIVLYKDNRYLAEVSETGDINLIYKLDNEYKYMYSFANEKGDNILIARIKVSEENSKNPDKPIVNEEIKYFILEIEERE
ncbi:hypothetical protein [Clostridium nigeriense]|uniref:hypothetical protein n=1 Tax=Clostridium nigeriense TaxID=1805470 RepID=UPI000830F33E|nr:hypothetical protein [Clostridium nigeriense]